MTAVTESKDEEKDKDARKRPATDDDKKLSQQLKKAKTESKPEPSTRPTRRSSNESLTDKKDEKKASTHSVANFDMFKKEKIPLPKIQKKKLDPVAAIKTDVKGAHVVKKEEKEGSPADGVKPMDVDVVPPSSGPVSYRKDRSAESPTEPIRKEGVPVPGSENYLSTGILMKKREKGLKVIWRDDNLEEIRIFETVLADGDEYPSSSHTPHQHGNARDLDRSEGRAAAKHMKNVQSDDGGIVATREWSVPRVLKGEEYVWGEETLEAERQRDREGRVARSSYFRKEDVPENPREGDEEVVDGGREDVKFIPLETVSLVRCSGGFSVGVCD